jgi:F-type H+-transporting ATPase subunit beta
MKQGTVVEIVGPVVDIAFEHGKLPEIYNAVKIPMERDGEQSDIIAEVAVHLGDNKVRCVAMSPTDGLRRGVPAEDTGQPICIPVGKEVLGRVINVLGNPVDQKGPIGATQTSPIHRAAIF